MSRRDLRRWGFSSLRRPGKSFAPLPWSGNGARILPDAKRVRYGANRARSPVTGCADLMNPQKTYGVSQLRASIACGPVLFKDVVTQSRPASGFESSGHQPACTQGELRRPRTVRPHLGDGTGAHGCDRMTGEAAQALRALSVVALCSAWPSARTQGHPALSAWPWPRQRTPFPGLPMPWKRKWRSPCRIGRWLPGRTPRRARAEPVEQPHSKANVAAPAAAPTGILRVGFMRFLR